MAVFTGKYKYAGSPDLKNFFKTVAGQSGEDAIKEFEKNEPVLEIIESADGKTFNINIYNCNNEKTVSYSFLLGKRFDEPFASSFTLKTIVTKDGSKLIFGSEISDGNCITRTYDFSKSKIMLGCYTDTKYGVTAQTTFTKL